MESLKEQFKNKPYINPQTKQIIVIGSNEYMQLEKKYGEPYKIKSPVSRKLISINKVAYKKLIKDGYTDQQIYENLSISLQTTHNISLNEDVLCMIYSHIDDIDTIASICSINKDHMTLCHQQTFWEPIFKYHNIPMVKLTNAESYIKYIRKKILPLTLLNQHKPNKNHTTFQYYGKQYEIPNIGDIIIIHYCNFSTYYILVTEVKLDKGKDGTIYYGSGLRLKGDYCDYVSSPAFVKSRSQLELTGKSYKINPKDRNRIIRIESLDL